MSTMIYHSQSWEDHPCSLILSTSVGSKFNLMGAISMGMRTKMMAIRMRMTMTMTNTMRTRTKMIAQPQTDIDE